MFPLCLSSLSSFFFFFLKLIIDFILGLMGAYKLKDVDTSFINGLPMKCMLSQILFEGTLPSVPEKPNSMASDDLSRISCLPSPETPWCCKPNEVGDSLLPHGRADFNPKCVLGILFWVLYGDRDFVFLSYNFSCQSNHFPTEVYNFKMIGKRPDSPLTFSAQLEASKQMFSW